MSLPEERKSVALHQQAGVLTPQAFAEREGMTVAQVMRCIRAGLVIGAQQDGRSRRWSIYPPAKLLRPVRKRAALGQAAAGDSPRSAERSGAEPSTGSGAVASPWPQGHIGASPLQAVAEEPDSLLQDGFDVDVDVGFDVAGQQALQARARVFPHALPEVYSGAKVRKACQRIRNEVARRYADGTCFLVLSPQEFRQVYCAVEQERNRKRNAVGKGLAKLRALRVSDSLWEILRRINGRQP